MGTFEHEKRGVGEGWQPLIAEVHAEIEALVPGYHINQIKEKFGGLRYYIGGVPTEVFEQVHAIIDAAEAKSFETCETCGQPGTPGTAPGSYWIKTLCDEHRAEHTAAYQRRQEEYAREEQAREERRR